MKRYNFNKLIRSNLPERMKKEGVYLSGRPLTDEEFAKELKNKLVEEAGEVQDTQSREDLIKELADVMEVIETITSLHSITKEEIEKERLLKCQINGHFLAANFVDYIEVPITNRKVIEYLQKRNRPYECN
ncbi:Nucleoside triphosphate pyrophosphohydrolase [Candidatus Megaera polyxenophila]|nr:Nucleoside triphosphate pyrophosphohydrolase [Candidatus Megaera polyxenophila]